MLPMLPEEKTMANEMIREIYVMFTPWWGKITCTLVGFIIAGPIGALLGLLGGNLLDKILFNHLFHPQWYHYRHASIAVKNLYFCALFKVMGHVAKSDGHVSEADIAFARKIMNEMNLHGRKKRLAMTYYNEGKKSNYNLQQSLTIIQRLCSHDIDMLRLFVETLYRTAKIDKITRNKQQRINIVFMRLGFKPMYGSKRHGHQQYSSYQPSSENSDYDILGVTSKTTVQEIKRAYRKKIRRIHPDKLIAKGASKKDIKIATAKTQVLQAAYDRIKDARGFS